MIHYTFEGYFRVCSKWKPEKLWKKLEIVLASWVLAKICLVKENVKKKHMKERMKTNTDGGL